MLYCTYIVSNTHDLPAGSYLIMPCTYYADKEGDFLLRLVGGDVATSKLVPAQEWNASPIDGAWVPGKNGGCQNHPTFQSNPKFSFSLSVASKVYIEIHSKAPDQKIAMGYYVMKGSTTVCTTKNRTKSLAFE
jgi:hypothetical protein